MTVLLDPANRARGGIKWGYVVHTVAMFISLMIGAVMSLYVQAFSYVEKREFPEGPFFYQISVGNDAISTVPMIFGNLGQWLTDGLLVSTTLDPAATSV